MSDIEQTILIVLVSVIGGGIGTYGWAMWFKAQIEALDKLDRPKKRRNSQ